MMGCFRLGWMIALAVALLLATDRQAAAAAAEIRYTVTHLSFSDPTVDPAGAAAHAINDLGQVTGTAGWGRPFRYSDGVMQPLGTIYSSTTGAHSLGLGINNLGQVVGVDAESASFPFLWTPGGTAGEPSNPQMQRLRGLAFDTQGAAHGINDHGHVAGFSTSTYHGVDHRAFLYDGTTTIDLGTLGGSLSFARAINNAGHVTGGAHTADGSEHAFLYTGGGPMVDIGQLVGPHYASWGTAINARGDVAGMMMVEPEPFAIHPIVYRDGVMTTLDFVGRADGINDAGHVVGESRPLDAAAFAFLLQDGVARDLNQFIDPASGWHLTAALDIDNHGQIVGQGTIGGVNGAFLLTPVPEPTATLPLVALALLARRRRR